MTSATKIQDLSLRNRKEGDEFFRSVPAGKEPPAITKEQFLWAVQVAAAAEQSWRNGSAVDLRNEAMDSAVVKTEIM